ncbi:hypothetical protein MRB53_000494 [Persea americana]|uniref:Uncharacterized protein n=1 Tax=Persea americana TaxID=3435 RepID=A0ACC2MP07_PERAE|nr:hypothetical protein MRB53_000494 [Persea americana]
MQIVQKERSSFLLSPFLCSGFVNKPVSVWSRRKQIAGTGEACTCAGVTAVSRRKKVDTAVLLPWKKKETGEKGDLGSVFFRLGPTTPPRTAGCRWALPESSPPPSLHVP